MSPYRMARIETDIRAVLNFKEAFNRHDISSMMQLMSQDCFLEHYHPAPHGTRYEGKEAVTTFWQDFFRQSPTAKLGRRRLLI